MNLLYRKTCRVCGSHAIEQSIDLGEQYLQGAFVKADTKAPPLRKIPTALMRCDPTQDEEACGLLQMACSVPPDILYSTYWYRSGTNRTMRDHLCEIATETTDFIGRKNATVLDIGCNDGTLLRAYPNTLKKIGIDPSDAVIGVKGEFLVIRDRFPSAKLLDALKGERLDAVTSIAMFYDLESPVSFAKSVKQVLAQDGVWVFAHDSNVCSESHRADFIRISFGSTFD